MTSTKESNVEMLQEEIERWKASHKELEAERDELLEEVSKLRKREFGPMTQLGIQIANELREQVFKATTQEQRTELIRKGAEMLWNRLSKVGKKKGGE